jgi:7,8-dihydro-6-hydroxymethylpterin-pyrophosphokinase
VTLVYLGLGSNLGAARTTSPTPSPGSRPSPAITKLAVSSVYETDPVGHLEQPRFLNMVAASRRTWSPRRSSTWPGRSRPSGGANGPSGTPPGPWTSTCSCTATGGSVAEGLTIPHPRMNDRPFVLVPLLELDPDLQEPGTGRRYVDILGQPGQAALEPALSGDRLVARGREADHEA